jgi:hypothetical protein
MRKICPEGRENRAQALSDELRRVFSGCLRLEHVSCLHLIVRWKFEGGAMLVSWHMTFGTSVFSATRNQVLFRVIPDERSKDRIYSPDQPIGAHHVNPLLACSYKWLNKPPHTIVKEAVSGDRVVLECFELRDW